MPKTKKKSEVTSFKTPNNAQELTGFLMNTMTNVVNKKIDPKIAGTVSRSADTTIRVVKAQMFYNKEKGYKRNITFLECR